MSPLGILLRVLAVLFLLRLAVRFVANLLVGLREEQARGEIVEVGRRLYARALINGNEGNVSVRLGETLLVTPPGVCKGFLTPDMLVQTDLSGRPTDGRRASTEVLMHAAASSSPCT